jgi:hypothetical protein
MMSSMFHRVAQKTFCLCRLVIRAVACGPVDSRQLVLPYFAPHCRVVSLNTSCSSSAINLDLESTDQ